MHITKSPREYDKRYSLRAKICDPETSKCLNKLSFVPTVIVLHINLFRSFV